MHIQIDRRSDTPLYRQVYNHIKHHILEGNLKSGTRLPPSRTLADQLSVSRIVVIEAYEMLAAEGYTSAKRGSGIFVKDNLHIRIPSPSPVPRRVPGLRQLKVRISFRSGLPALDLFPRQQWGKCYKEALDELPNTLLGYDAPAGFTPFRKTLAAYLLRARGIRCHENQIIITSGAVQSIYLLSLYLKAIPGKLLIEEPTTSGLRDLLEENRIPLIHHPIDDTGIDPSTLPNDDAISAVLTTPSHQYPLGGALTIDRRIGLIQFAREQNCLLIEDDYDSEFRYAGGPVESLFELDPERVVYIGSFSKILLPSIRIGYAVLPVHLIEPMNRLKLLVDIHSPTLNQAAMDRFIRYGYLERHLLKSRKRYEKRRQALTDSLKEHFGPQVSILGSPTGLHLVARFSDIKFDPNLVRQIFNAGVEITPVSDHALKKERHRSDLIFGFGNLTEARIETGISIIREAINTYSDGAG